jgi:antitoxin VapB
VALHVEDPETERLAAEIAALTGETTAQAVRVALEERRQRLGRDRSAEERLHRLRRLLEEEIWPQIEDARGRPISKAEREEILGYGPEGV